VAALSDEEVAARALAVIDADNRAVGAAAACVGPDFVRVARLLASCRGKVLVTGSGTSGIVASRAAHLFSFCGTPSFYLSPADGLHGGLGALQPDDFVIALSKFGGSDELNEFCRLARARCSGLAVVTARAASPLTALADVVLAIHLEDDADLGGIAATGSSLAMGAIIDALVEVARLSRGVTWEAMLDTHPLGGVAHDARARQAAPGDRASALGSAT